MNKQNEKNVVFTIPGDKIAVVEEFISGHGTFEEKGTIYSKFVGYISKDLKEKVVTVNQCTRDPLVPKEGEKIIGFVRNTSEKMATVEIVIIGDKETSTPFSALLHISNSSAKYERFMNEVCKIGDVLKAKIINVKNRLPQLETIGGDLGVIQAYCSKCGEPLSLKNNVLKCSCGNIEQRKLSTDYFRSEGASRLE